MRVFPINCGLVVWIGFGLSALAAAPISFVTNEVEYRLGESVMIPLKVDAPVAETTAHELKLQKQGIVEILRQPEILKDQDIGFARIRTLTPGEVVLKCGDASISRMRRSCNTRDCTAPSMLHHPSVALITF